MPRMISRARIRRKRTGKTERRRRLVYRPKRVWARVILGDALTPKQAGIARVACADGHFGHAAIPLL